MRRMKRREFLELAAAGCFAAGVLPDKSQAQPQQASTPAEPKPPASPLSSLEAAAVRVAEAEGRLEKSYFWQDMHTLLVLYRVPKEEIYHAVLVDTTTGEKTVPAEFNAKNSLLMQA